MSKKVLMLGGTGAMGVYLAPELLERGYEVFITSRKEHTSNEKKLHYIVGSGKDPLFIEKLLSHNSFDAIIDFMVYSTEEFKSRYEYLLQQTSHYIFLSSYRVYADNGLTPITENSPRLLDCSTDEKYLATDEYALAKARQENLLVESGYKNWTIVRPAITYSKDRFQLGTMEANEFLFRALKGKPIIFPEDLLGKETTMSWAGDVAKMIAALVFNPKAFSEAFTVSTSEHQQWKTVLKYYTDLTHVPVKIVSMDIYKNIIGRPWQIKYDRMFNRVIDNSKILSITGLKQQDLMLLKDGLHIELTNFSRNPIYSKIDSSRERKIDELTKGCMPVIDIKYIIFRVIELHHEGNLWKKITKKINNSSFLQPIKKIKRKFIKQYRKLISQINGRLYDGAIITLTGNYNYGSIMQRWALQQTLKKAGYKYKIFDLKFMLNMSKKTGDRTATTYFVKRNLDIEVFDPDCAGNFKTYIVGSDQVWRDFFNDWKKFGVFFLNFVKSKNAKRIGYGISFGADTLSGANINKEKKALISPLVKKFDSVSVREKSGLKMLNELGINGTLVLDPTFLMIKDEYSNLINKSVYSNFNTHPIFYYILDRTSYKEKIINNISQNKGLKADGIFPNDGKPLVSPEIWLKGFRDAKYIVTDSFHGMVFSIINQKPFIVFANKARGVSRMTDLLDLLGLNDRILYDDDQNWSILDNAIDWSQVEQRLKDLREESINWLIDNLRNKHEEKIYN